MGDDKPRASSHTLNMAAPIGPDWFLKEWAESLGLNQADFGRALELHKNSANRLWHSEQPYRRDQLNAAAAWLHIRPYELLMHPEEAHAIRRMRELAARMVADNTKPSDRPDTPPARARKAS